jgi:hypothetical protein
MRLQVFRLVLATTESRKKRSLKTLKTYRDEFGELTKEDIDYIFGYNDSVLSITNVNDQNLLNYACAKLALGIDDLSTCYDPYYSSGYADMHARNEIDQQRSIISLYNETVNSRRRIQRMTGGKKQGLYVDVKISEDNYETIILETMERRKESIRFAFAFTSFASYWSMRTGLKSSTSKVSKNLPFKDSRLKSQIENVIESFDKTGKPPEGVWQGGRRGQQRGLFMNDKGKLPIKPHGYYTESDIWPGSPGNRGAERLIIGRGGEVYYTPDHYKKFVRIR